MAKKDYYEVLEIPRSANSSEIKKAYLTLAKKYHPDTNSGDSSAEAKFKEISEAYEILKDEQKRAAYDRMGHSAFEQGGGAGFNSRGFSGNNPDINDIFGDFFSDFMGGGRSGGRARASQARGSDLKYNLNITLEEAFTGVDKKINFNVDSKCSPCDGKGTNDPNANTTCPQCGGTGAIRTQQGFFAIEQTCNKCNGQGHVIKNPCVTCHGSGRSPKHKNLIVNIPHGVEDGVRIRIAGEGEAGFRGGSVGDLYVFISVAPHNIYQVEGSNLHCKLPLNFTKAALGGEVEIPIIDGSMVKLKIPAGTQTGDKLKLKGKGMSKVRSSERGDLYAHAFVQTPKDLTKKQKELLEALDKEFGETKENYSNDGFFSKVKNIWS
jgi:molecular chaperone DnaJ